MSIQAFTGNFVPLAQTSRSYLPAFCSPRRPRHSAQTLEVVACAPCSPGNTDSSVSQSSTVVSRRDVLNLLATVVASPAVFSLIPSAAAAGTTESTTPVSQLILPPLPYSPSALEPAIDRETMILHHDKHFAKYTEGANAALAKIPGGTAMVDGDPAKLADMLGNLESVKDESIRNALRNNGGGYLNHYQFFATMGPANADRAKSGPDGLLGDAIAETFGSFQSFREQFTKAALTLFGSGFVYLVRDRKSGGQLAIKQYSNQDTPVMDGELPIVGLDVWEHAYYKKYSNRRGEYVDAWFSVVNWDLVGKNYRPVSTSTTSSVMGK